MALIWRGDRFAPSRTSPMYPCTATFPFPGWTLPLTGRSTMGTLSQPSPYYCPIPSPSESFDSRKLTVK